MPDSRPQPPHSPDPSGPAGRGPLLLTGARLTDGRTVDVRLCGERIEAVGTAGSLTAGTAPGTGTRVDLTGYLLLPAPADPHVHGDTVLTADAGGPVPYAAGDVRRRVTEAALLQLGHGATALRAHVRVDDMQGLGALTAVLRARRSLCGLTGLTAVAMPGVLTGAAGADGRAVLRDALKTGACAVGGCPDLDPDPTGYVEAVLEAAAEHGCPVDLHTDAADPARLARLAAMAGGLRPGVALGPCGGLGRLPAEVASRTADQLAAAGVAVVCLPQGGCGSVDRRDGTAPVRLLRAAGVRVAAGSGALRDMSNPVGRGDPLEAAYLLASCHGLRPEDAYDAVSASARAVLGLPEVRVEAGFPAELLAVRGDRLSAALSPAYSRVVVHRGRVVARTSAVREYGDATTAADPGLPRQGRGELS
ncbi:amidohydrolase family protein [Streptomyces leeuwenhoekii]|uniref:Hydrolase n=1 Tax=Streptomyces leeuwenhoekii TaxID=1437453 RepID=A0A0F7VQ33_STRLW|nr:amidohydrolase family protein [Streptomyces leeuwenhoekii]KMS69019.1 hydrolase [Streptomyces leeuwenhoekii]CQR62464.1 Hydrolase [Streptomyces leeuwenhoekii]